MDNKLIAIILIGAAVLLFLTAAPSIALTQNFTDAFKKDGSLVQCDISFDKDSVLAARCSKIDECRTGFPFFLGIGNQDTTVRLLVGGRTYATETYETTFGYNKDASINACVPSTATAIDVQVLTEQGTVADGRSAPLQ